MKRLFAVFIGLLFATVVVLTVGVLVTMDEHGNMLDCPYTEGDSSLCAMTGLEHLAEWKMNFLAMTQGQNIFLIPILVFTGFVFLAFLKDQLQLERVKLKWRERKNDTLKLLDTFVLLLSLGILHPRLYQNA